jgi:hypothetical protein
MDGRVSRIGTTRSLVVRERVRWRRLSMNARSALLGCSDALKFLVFGAAVNAWMISRAETSPASAGPPGHEVADEQHAGEAPGDVSIEL